MRFIKYISLCLLLSSCSSLFGDGGGASVSKTYSMSGKTGYTVNCSGAKADWGLCYQAAGDICKEKGYDIVQVTGESGTSSEYKSTGANANSLTNTTYSRIMLIECKDPAPPPLQLPIPQAGKALPPTAPLPTIVQPQTMQPPPPPAPVAPNQPPPVADGQAPVEYR